MSADELVDSRHGRAVRRRQVLKCVVLVHALEGADRVTRDGDLVPADERAVRGMAHADVRVLARDDDLVDPPLLELLVEAGVVEGAVVVLLGDDVALRRREGLDDLGPGSPAMACSPQIAISGSSESWASFEKTTTQPSSRAWARSRCRDGVMSCAFGLASLPSQKSFSMSMMMSAFMRLLLLSL